MSKGIIAGIATIGLFAIALAFSGGAAPQDRAIEIAEGVQMQAIAVAEDARAQGCSIKGNINRAGERIYHMPDGRFYERIKIDEGAGERYFCWKKMPRRPAGAARSSDGQRLSARSRQRGPDHPAPSSAAR